MRKWVLTIHQECHWPSLSVSGSRSRSSHTPQDHAAHLQTSISPGVSVSGGIDQNTSPARATGTVGGTGISSREVDAQVDELFGNVDVNGHVNVGIMADSTTQRYDTSPGFADLLTGISAGPIDLSWGMASSSGQGERVVWGASEREPWDGSFNMDEFLSTDFVSTHSDTPWESVAVYAECWTLNSGELAIGNDRDTERFQSSVGSFDCSQPTFAFAIT